MSHVDLRCIFGNTRREASSSRNYVAACQRLQHIGTPLGNRTFGYLDELIAVEPVAFDRREDGLFEAQAAGVGDRGWGVGGDV